MSGERWNGLGLIGIYTLDLAMRSPQNESIIVMALSLPPRATLCLATGPKCQ